MKKLTLWSVIIVLVATMVFMGLVACKATAAETTAASATTAASETTAASATTAASETTAAATATGEAVTINYITLRQDDQVIMAELTKRFHEKYPNITVNYSFNKDQSLYYQTVKAGIMSDSADLDVFDHHPNNDYVSYARGGFLADLSDLPFNAVYNDAGKQHSIVDGKNYGFLTTTNYICLFYDKDVFSGLGLAVPNTFDDLTKTVNTLKSNNYGGIGYLGADVGGFWMYYMALVTQTNGPAIYEKLYKDIDTGAVTDLSTVPEAYNAYKALEAIATNKLLYDNASSIKYDQETSLFAQKKAPLMMFGTWTLSPHDTLYPGINIGIAPFPTPYQTGVTYEEPSVMACIYAKSRNLDACKTWLTWFADPNGGANYYAQNSLMASTIKGTDLGDSPMAQVLKQITKANCLPTVLLDNSDLWQTPLNDSFASVLFGEKTADKAIADLKDQLVKMNLATR